jgi:hypothetical protein
MPKRWHPQTLVPNVVSAWSPIVGTDPAASAGHNGRNPPLWRELPENAFRIPPSAIGVPKIRWTLFPHPVALEHRAEKWKPVFSKNDATTNI